MSCCRLWFGACDCDRGRLDLGVVSCLGTVACECDLVSDFRLMSECLDVHDVELFRFLCVECIVTLLFG